MSRGTRVFLFFSLLIISLVVLVVATWPSSNQLKLVACDVGQGDAILAIHKNYQVLVDAGPGRAVIDCLSRHMPFWDRRLEVVMITHADLDHYGGILDVFNRYKVDSLAITGIGTDSRQWDELEKIVSGSNTRIVYVNSDTLINLGKLQIDVAWPTKDYLTSISSNAAHDRGDVLGMYSTTEVKNNTSIVALFSFGDFDALLTGDILPEVSDEVIATGEIVDIEYLKVPHHGSKNGLTQILIDAATPEYAVVSSGKNPWGHPHKEVLDMLDRSNIKIYQTVKQGDIILDTDGRSLKFY